jgi:arsenite methyltransferase
MAQLAFDQQMVEQMEVVYRAADILRRRRAVYDALDATRGDRIVDVGCGPGFYAAELLDQVGEDGAVVGLDASPQMLAVAAHRCEGHANVEFHQADATSLPVEDGSCDRVVCVQVLEYVADVDTGLRELHRVLRPGGRAVVWDVDWATLSWHSGDPDRMERMLRAWDEHLAHPSLPRTLVPRLRAAGFEEVAMEAHAFASAELSPDAYASALLPLITKYVAGVEGIGEEAANAWEDEQRELGERGEFYVACMQFCFSATRAG